MRYRVLFAIAYLVVMTTWIYGALDRSESGGVQLWLLALVGVLQLAAGFLIGRWPAVVLPILVVLISVPAGYPPVEGGEPFPLWFDLAVLAFVAIPLVAIGVTARKLSGRGSGSSARAGATS